MTVSWPGSQLLIGWRADAPPVSHGPPPAASPGTGTVEWKVEWTTEFLRTAERTISHACLVRFHSAPEESQRYTLDRTQTPRAERLQDSTIAGHLSVCFFSTVAMISWEHVLLFIINCRWVALPILQAWLPSDDINMHNPIRIRSFPGLSPDFISQPWRKNLGAEAWDEANQAWVLDIESTLRWCGANRKCSLKVWESAS